MGEHIAPLFWFAHLQLMDVNPPVARHDGPAVLRAEAVGALVGMVGQRTEDGMSMQHPPAYDAIDFGQCLGRRFFLLTFSRHLALSYLRYEAGLAQFPP